MTSTWLVLSPAVHNPSRFLAAKCGEFPDLCTLGGRALAPRGNVSAHISACRLWLSRRSVRVVTMTRAYGTRFQNVAGSTDLPLYYTKRSFSYFFSLLCDHGLDSRRFSIQEKVPY